MSAVGWYEPERRGEVALWSVAAAIVVAAHVAVVTAYMLLRPAPEDGAAAPTVDVEFVPLPAQPAPAADSAQPVMEESSPPLQQAHEEPPPEQASPPPPEQTPPPVLQVEALPPPEPPPPPVQTATAVDVPPPEAKPIEIVPPKPVELERPKPKPIVARPEHAPPAHPEKQADHHETHAAPMRVATAPNLGASAIGARDAEASWRSALAAHLARYKPEGTRDSGTVELSFTMDRNGHVLSRRVLHSSGSATLDQAAMAMVERAQPLPAFLPGMPEARKTLTLPVHFSVR